MESMAIRKYDASFFIPTFPLLYNSIYVIISCFSRFVNCFCLRGTVRPDRLGGLSPSGGLRAAGGSRPARRVRVPEGIELSKIAADANFNRPGMNLNFGGGKNGKFNRNFRGKKGKK